jgi:uncharacterized glyoxalase superfamily protein PhnB
MTPQALSTCITTDKIDQTRDFYVRHFAAKAVFDCGWYINLEFGGKSASLQFMSPQPGQALCNPAGMTYNFCVADVDAEFEKLTVAGLATTMPLEDHPWGDRGFAVEDPNGVTLYIYAEREPSAEFQAFYKS